MNDSSNDDRDDRPARAGGSATAQPKSSATPRKTLMLALKLMAGLLIIAAPILVAGIFVEGVFSVAFYAILAAAFGWISGGPKVAFAVISSLAVLGVISILLREQLWALALILLLLGLAYGYAASRGFGSAVLQLPILTPYFMMEPPPLFNNPPTIDLAYIVGVVVIMLLAGAWAILVLRIAGGKRSQQRAEVQDRRLPLIYGGILGALSVVVMILGTTSEYKLHWVWVTLTLYVLADPRQLFSWKKMIERLLGTLAGFGAVFVLMFVGVPDQVMQILAVPALGFCIAFLVIKKPYWQYTLLLTMSVVLMASSGASTLVLNTERFGFTLIGAGATILAAFLVNLLFYHRARISITNPDFSLECNTL